MTAALALVLLLAAAGVLPALAVTLNPEEQDFTVKVNSPDAEDGSYDELKNANVVLDVYQIAVAEPVDGSDAYSFTYIPPFTDAAYQFGTVASAAEAAEKDLTAQDVSDYAQTLAKRILFPGEDDFVDITLEGRPLDEAFKLPTPGLFLIIPHGSDIEDYAVETEDGNVLMNAQAGDVQFQFAPILISVPMRGYTPFEEEVGLTGDAELLFEAGLGDTSSTEAWDYDIEIDAKVGIVPAPGTGRLKITKKLLNHESVGTRTDEATFVFDVEVWDSPEKVNLVYSNVIPMVFTKAGSQTVEIPQDFTVGSYYEVTEETPTGNYTPVGETAAAGEIIADDPETVEVEAAEAEFTNDYNKTWNGGGSVTNHFAGNDSEKQYSDGRRESLFLPVPEPKVQ